MDQRGILPVKPGRLFAYVALAATLMACSEQEEILVGERFGLRSTAEGETSGAADAGAAPAPITLPAPVASPDWTHRNGSASHRVPHPALAATPAPAWSADIGAGNSRKHRITADPVVADGRVFVMDSESVVTALSLAGERLWSVSVAPGFDNRNDASGGGLAAADGSVYATTGFGTLSALEAETGAMRWTQRVDGAVTGAPTVFGELVYIVSRDGVAWAINTGDGRIAWSLSGNPTQSVMSGGAGPAVTDQIAVFPFGSGDLIASFPRGGVRLWTASLAGQRLGRAYAGVTDITGDPVIDGDKVYSGTSSGRIAAIGLRSGERLWTANEGAMSPVWPAGGAVFAVTDEARLVRLSAGDGRVIWATDLPYFLNEKPKRRGKVHPSFGPVLAGGLLRVASGDGMLRSFDPETGALVSEVAIPGGAATNMAVAGGTLYVVSARGQLHAFR